MAQQGVSNRRTISSVKYGQVRYSWDLKSGLVGISNGRKEVRLQMVWILNGIRYPEAQPFEIRSNGCNFFKNHQILTGPILKWLGL